MHRQWKIPREIFKLLDFNGVEIWTPSLKEVIGIRISEILLY
jgi:hypothetical protein